MKVLAIIGARGGSKGIPKKNIAMLGDKPLIGWTVEAAVKAAEVDRVVVSTDDPDIAAVARHFGAEIPFMRPAELATDTASQVDVVNHVLDRLEKEQHYSPDYLLLLQPTSPFRTSEDIDAAIKIAADKDCDAVISVSAVASHPYYARTIDAEGIIQDMYVERNTAPRRQLLPEVFSENGAIYLLKVSVFRSEQTFMPARSAAYVMPEQRSLDIDTPWDMKLAAFMMSAPDRSGD